LAKPASLNKAHKNHQIKIVHKPPFPETKNFPGNKPLDSKRLTPLSKTATTEGFLAAASKRKPVIVIDPGHGGKDPGATGSFGTKEKNITLKYSLALKKELEKTGKYKVVMTRKENKFISLSERVRIAQKAGGDVLISIHADSIANPDIQGFSVYTLSERRKDSEAKKLLEKANHEDVIRGANIKGESKDVQEAIINFAQDSSKDISNDFAATIGRNLGKEIHPLVKNQREGSLAVLTGADIPSVLIELGYLSNKYEEKALLDNNHMEKFVLSLTTAINEYFSKFNLVF